MTRDEAAALQALARSLGWKILQREFGRQREAGMGLIMSLGTEPAVREREVLIHHGITRVLEWPAQAIASYREEHGEQPDVLRAGIGVVREEG